MRTIKNLSVAHMTAAKHSNTARPRKYIYSSALELADIICEQWANNFFCFLSLFSIFLLTYFKLVDFSGTSLLSSTSKDRPEIILLENTFWGSSDFLASIRTLGMNAFAILLQYFPNLGICLMILHIKQSVANKQL